MRLQQFIKKFLSKVFQKKEASVESFSIMKIGEYQFTNILSTPIRFLVLDLRSENKKPELRRALKATEENYFAVVKENIEESDFPILIVCETGTKSLNVANSLSQKYKNVVYLEGGTQSLSADFHQNTPALMYR